MQYTIYPRDFAKNRSFKASQAISGHHLATARPDGLWDKNVHEIQIFYSGLHDILCFSLACLTESC